MRVKIQIYPTLIAWTFALLMGAPLCPIATADEAIPELSYYAEYDDAHIVKIEYKGTKKIDSSHEEYFEFNKPIRIKG